MLDTGGGEGRESSAGARADASDVPETSAADSPASAGSDEGEYSAQEKYAFLTRYGAQILAVLHPETGCAYLSENWQRITGHSIAASMGERFFGLMQPDFQQRLLERVLPAAKAHSSLKGKLRHADGSWQWYTLSVAPQDGHPGRYVCVIENIQEFMQTQNVLQKARMEAELALRARSEFLANMSHELRTPLNAVIGFAQIMESEVFGKIQSPQHKEYVQHIQESGYELLAKIEDLLEIANIDAGRVELRREEVRLSALLKYVLEAYGHQAFSARVALHCQSPPHDMLLNLDRLKMQHILGHLITNAIKFNHQGGRVQLECTHAADGGFVFQVSDTGVGMTQAKLQTVIHGLKEENCWVTAKNSGIGLGLALAKEFITLHGGAIDIDSQPGAGTLVRLALPPDCVVRALEKKVEYLRAAN